MATVAFATIEEYEARYGEVEDEQLLQQVLDDATRKIIAECRDHGVDTVDPDDFMAEALAQVCRDMAHRALETENGADASEIPVGATNYSTSADGFSKYYGFQSAGSSGFGDLYITKSEKRLLGLSRMRVGIATRVPGWECH